MTTRHFFHFSHRVLILGASLLLAHSLRAASANPSEQRQTLWSQAVINSQVQFRAGRYEQGERLLFDLNRSQPGTAEWHVESARALLRVGLLLRQGGSGQIGAELGSRALAQLQQAEQKPGTSANITLASSIKEMAGMICERLSGNTETARAYYRAAVQLNPSARGAANALNKMDEADQKISARQQGNPGR